MLGQEVVYKTVNWMVAEVEVVSQAPVQGMSLSDAGRRNLPCWDCQMPMELAMEMMQADPAVRWANLLSGPSRHLCCRGTPTAQHLGTMTVDLVDPSAG